MNGIVFHIDFDAYRVLSDYLQDIELRLPQDEREDVMSDVEARICELLQSALFAKNVQVVDMAMIEAIKTRIGAPEDFGENKRPKMKSTPHDQRSGCSRVLRITLYVILILFALQILFPVIAVVFALCMAAFGLSVGAFSALPFVGNVFFAGNAGGAILTVIAATVVIGLPIYALIKTIVTYMRTHKGPGGRFWLISLLIWLLSLICFSSIVYHEAKDITDWKALPHTISRIDIYDGEDSTAVHINFLDEDGDEGYLEIEE